jgi:hypothetical protein
MSNLLPEDRAQWSYRAFLLKYGTFHAACTAYWDRAMDEAEMRQFEEVSNAEARAQYGIVLALREGMLLLR